MMRVLSPGLLTTVQDLGRYGFSHLGVSAAGAADPVSLRIANRLVGNEDGAAVLEMTLRGGRFEVLADVVVSLCGGEFEASIPMWQSVSLRGGSMLEIGGSRSGARCYLAVAGGGFRSERILGSASTHLLSGFGCVLSRGTVLESVGVSPGLQKSASERRRWDMVRVTVGAESAEFSGSAMFQLLSQEWTVSEQSNRQGVRLKGASLEIVGGGAMASEGVALGAIQVPPGGEPVILFVDSQTTGGYPVIANVAAVDIGVVGQLRPGAKFRFAGVSLAEARGLLREQESWIRGI